MFNHKILKDLRECQEKSIDDVVMALRALEVKISGQTLRNWEDGATVPDAVELKALADFYKKDITTFYN